MILKKEKQKLILPLSYSVDLAEETGIHIGDGSMGLYKSGNKSHWHYTYCCHSIDDNEFGDYVKKLMKKLYNLDPVTDKKRKDNTRILRYTRKDMVLFKEKLGLPLGAKEDIKIPRWIIKNRDFKIACVKGIFATDGSLQFQKKYKTINYYPQLKITSKSKLLVNQIDSIFKEFDIKSSISCDARITKRHPNKIWSVFIYGKDNLEKFVKIISFSNPKQQKKYYEWKNSGSGGI